MSVRIALLLVALPINLSSQSPPAATPAVTKWLAGLDSRKEGLERLRAKLKHLAEGPNGNMPGGVPRAIGCPLALESALVVALTHGHLTKSDTEEFHLIIHAANESEYLDVAYSYNRRGALVTTGIIKIPSEWIVGFQPDEADLGKFLVATDDRTGCTFQFDSVDPFRGKALAQREP